MVCARHQGNAAFERSASTSAGQQLPRPWAGERKGAETRRDVAQGDAAVVAARPSTGRRNGAARRRWADEIEMILAKACHRKLALDAPRGRQQIAQAALPRARGSRLARSPSSQSAAPGPETSYLLLGVRSYMPTLFAQGAALRGRHVRSSCSGDSYGGRWLPRRRGRTSWELPSHRRRRKQPHAASASHSTGSSWPAARRAIPSRDS